jgi:hypothetical protein
MPRSLKTLTGERPRCQYCDKPLRPATSTLELSGHLDEPPEEKRVAAGIRYSPHRIFRFQHGTNINGQPITKMSFWRGTYEGYGTGKDGTRLFCSQPCGVLFGIASWNAGMRIKDRKDAK